MFEPRLAAVSALANESTTSLGPFGSKWTTYMLADCEAIPGCNTTGYLMDGGGTIISPSG